MSPASHKQPHRRGRYPARVSNPDALRAARLAAICALIGALLGAAIPGVFLLTATDRQVTADTARSRADFLRLQRQIAYAKLVTDARTLDQLVQAVDERSRQTDPVGDDCSARIEANQLYDAVQNDVATVELIGSDAAREAAGNVLQLFTGGIVGVVCQEAGVEKVSRLVHPRGSPTSTSDALQRFTEAGRHDLVR